MDNKEVARAVARIGVSLVFLWFGINQLISPENFFGYMPGFIAEENFSQVIMLNGIFEILAGGFLILGFLTKWAALVLGLHLIVIMYGLGYNDIAVRDFGLALVLFSIFIGGADKWCLEQKKK